jgi:predicted nucleotidyltransferase component of viral defense system
MTDRGPRLYPTTLDKLDEWRSQSGATSDEARRRFVQFVVLESIASADIARSLAFKGGNALRFGYGYPRSTVDLDFTAMDLEDDGPALRGIVNRAVILGSERFGIKCRVTSVKRRPPNRDRTLPTYIVKVAYVLPGDRYFPEFDDRTNWAAVLPIEITFNDVICETSTVHFGDDGLIGITLCTLNDIVAEKLRAIIQQVIRNRNRPQDVYDIARSWRVNRTQLDVARIGQYLRQKCLARGIQPDISLFGPEARTRAAYGYGELESDLEEDFIAFEEAWDDVVTLAKRALDASEDA